MKIISKKNAPQSGKYAAISKAAQVASPRGVKDIIESDDDDTGPGPGQYYDAQQSTFKPETRPQRLQFFGSTVERFTENNKFKLNEDIGPGTYPTSGSLLAKSAKAVPQKPYIGFASG